MTPEQRTLARHALGLPNLNKESYRNRYHTMSDHLLWNQMVEAGEAKVHKFRKRFNVTGDMFYLTRKGAELALDKGETLCPEDFPKE